MKKVTWQEQVEDMVRKANEHKKMAADMQAFAQEHLDKAKDLLI